MRGEEVYQDPRLLLLCLYMYMYIYMLMMPGVGGHSDTVLFLAQRVTDVVHLLLTVFERMNWCEII